MNATMKLKMIPLPWMLRRPEMIHPPMKAPTMPTMMSTMIPKPRPLTTRPASAPAMPPMMIHQSQFTPFMAPIICKFADFANRRQRATCVR